MTKLGLAILVLLASGCTTARQSFPGHAAPSVWTALKAVAQSPDYDHPDANRRWTVEENAVWVDETSRRLEIYRRLARRVHLPRAAPRREDRTWRFQVALDVHEPVPHASFISRGWATPSKVRDEADRYFLDVLALLQREPAGTAPRPIDRPALDAPPAIDIIDIAPPPAPMLPTPASRPAIMPETRPVSPDPRGNMEEIGDAPPVDIEDLLPG